MLARIGVLLFGSVRRQLIVGIAAAAILLTGAFVAYQVQWQSDFLLKRQTEHAFGLARTLAGSSAGWVAARDAAGLQELVDARHRYGKIYFAIVTDARGLVLAATDMRQIGRHLLDLPKEAKEILFSDKLNRVDVAAPVLVNDRLVGWVRVGLGDANIAQQIAHIRWSGLLFALVATLVATGFAVWLGQRLTKRLNILDSAMARIEAGEDQTPVVLSGTDEASRLATGFNRMLDALAQRERARQQEEDALNAAIAYSRSLIEASLDPLVTISAEGKITDVNDATVQATGVSREALIGSDFSNYFTEPEKARAGYEEVFAKGFVRDYPLALRNASGKVIDVIYNANIYRDEKGDVAGVFAAARDITELKQAQALLDARVRQLAAIVELGLHILQSKDLVRSLDEAAQVVARTLGVEFCEILERRAGKEELLLHHGVGWREGLVGRATVEAGAGSQAGYTLQSATPVILDDLRSETRFRAPALLLEHNVVSGLTVVIPGRDEPFGVLGAHTAKRRTFSNDDINFLQAAANMIAAAVQQIRASLYMRSLIEASLDPLVTISAEGKITDVNEATVQATGVSRKALVDSDFSAYFTEPEKARAGYKEVFAKGYVRDYPLALRGASGKTIDVLYNASVYRDENDEVAGVFAVARDITERKHAELVLKRVNRTLRTLSAANETLVRSKSEQELLNDMCRVVVEVGGYRLAWIGFAEQDESRTVRPVASAGEHPEFLDTANITWSDTERGRGPSGSAIRTGKATTCESVSTNPDIAPWRADMLKLKFLSCISLPLRRGSETIGCLTLYADEADAFEPQEIELLVQLADDLSFGIQAQRDRVGRMLAVSALQDALKSAVAAIASAVEKRDVYTAGHQQRVAELATALAREIGLPEQQIEGIYLAGMIHDVGKITVPSELLSKPGKLSPLEYELIQTHVQSGYDIIKGIKFPWPIDQMILQHHERLDGSGYPNRLRGDAIQIGARILAVADVVDAMMSHRPYRPALGVEAPLAEIEKEKGRLYDPAVVDACLGLFRQKGFKFD